MKANNKNQADSESILVPASEQRPKDAIKILGTWGLSYNTYNCAQLLVLLMIIKYLQKVITEQVITQKLHHGNYPKTPEQIARKAVFIAMWLKDFGFIPQHYARLRQTLLDMSRLPIAIPFKQGETTLYMRFPCLFEVKQFAQSKGRPYVYLAFPLGVWDLLMSCDKGYATLDINAVRMMRSVYSRKMYISMQNWLNRGIADMYPDKVMLLLKGAENAYTHYGELENHVLLVAQQELKRLYDQRIIDEYFDYNAYYKNNIKVQMPTHITFKLQKRIYLEADAETNEELKSLQAQLSVKLRVIYNVSAEKADSMSKRLRLSDVGDLHTWFQHRDDRIKQCQMHNRQMNPAGYIVNGLKGFFTDHGC